MWLALSLIAVTFGGLALNNWLLWRIHSSVLPRWHAVTIAVFFGFMVHLILLLGISKAIIAVFEVSSDQRETVGYFVGPILLAFVSAPATLLLLRVLSRAGAELEQPAPPAR